MSYLGIHEIAGEEAESSYVRVSFVDTPEGKKVPSVLLSKQVLEKSRTEEPADGATLKNNRCEIVAAEVVAIFLKHNIHIHSTAGDMNQITSLVTNMLNNNIEDAEEARWGIHPYHMDLVSVDREVLKAEEKKSAEKDSDVEDSESSEESLEPESVEEAVEEAAPEQGSAEAE